MKKKSLSYILLVFTILATSCAVTKPYETPAVGPQGLYRDSSSAADTSNMANLHWTEIFRDTLLQNLIQEGIAGNLNLKIAWSHIQQAQANFEQSRLAFLPNVSADASAMAGKIAKTTSAPANTQLYQLGVNASWEADLWGRLKSSKRAALASLLQSEAYSRVVQTALVGSIANYYYTLLGLDQQLTITEQSVKNWISTVEVMKALKDADIVTGQLLYRVRPAGMLQR